MTDAARAYEALFVPALFEQWTPVVADLAQIRPGERVLDVACGTGVLARHVAGRVGPNGRVVGLDPNAGMLAVARELAPAIDWRQGMAESLPFPDASFEAVVSQFGLMFFSDRGQALREMLRVLAPRRRLVVAVFDTLGNNPAYAAEVELLSRLAGRPAAEALSAPFALGDPYALRALFADAGATWTELSTHRGTARFPSLAVMLEADLRGWLPMVGVALGEDTISRVLAAADDALAGCVSRVRNGIEFDLSAHIVSASH
jgi:SAM-dependent methyltransferase